MLHEMCRKYDHIDCRDLGSRQLEQLREGLKKTVPSEIMSADSGNQFINLLRKFREAVAENDKLHGDNYPQLLNSILSVGEDGLYSNSLRFIFELIQNVDDCDFANPEDCVLDMQFKFDEGEIILTYNEVGFTPFNVFAITGIAEAAKNVSEKKNEIGEKGIGFKSVFGVAEKVHIQSGWFSFELHKSDFTIPVPVYAANYNFVPGTKMTLYVPGKAKEIYSQIKKQYCRKDAIFSRNPLLFLNKLTTLKIYFDDWRSMEFHVSSKPVFRDDKIHRDDNIDISVDLHDYENGQNVNVTERIRCTRYTKAVRYSQDACKSRYGNNTAVGSNNGKAMLLQVVIPNPEYVTDVGNGNLYSFLPTQIGLTVPVVCHVPFKLDASREFVDPQGENTWFKDSCRYFSELLDSVYEDWCVSAGTNIICYLPGRNESLFSPNNGKEKCLSKQEFYSGSHFLKKQMFITTDGTLEAAADIYCFAEEEEIQDPENVHKLLGFTKSLFLPPSGAKPLKYGISIEKNVNRQLFKRAFAYDKSTSDILDYLDAVNFEYIEKYLPSNEAIRLSPDQIAIIMRHVKLGTLFQSISCQLIKQSKRPRFIIKDAKLDGLTDLIHSDFDISETPRQIEKYLKFCNAEALCIDIEENQFLPCHNGLILSSRNILASLAAFCYAIDQRDTFAIRVKLREASRRLNQYVENNDGLAVDYLRDLKNIRLLVKDSLGNEGYRSYIDLILKSGTVRGRFVQEILQNADDCIYPTGEVPAFKLWNDGNTVVTEYNETGFTRANIRSITAIGESTKNKLLNSEYKSIGEKGVGFKTVFSAASEVRIFSGEYNFFLTDREPTIPKVLKTQQKQRGTRMEIVLKDRSAFPEYNDKAILELVLCLRKLKSIEISNHTVSIEDNELQRIITIDRRQYIFKKYEYDFVVTSTKALDERKNGTKAISPEQKITCYVPEKNMPAEYRLYVGLPTKHKLNIPMVIDAPFELTTSREEIEDDCVEWNRIVRDAMYKAVIRIIHLRKADERANVLRFARFLHRIAGNTMVYRNGLSDSDYLNEYSYLIELRKEKILPTLNLEYFASVNDKQALRYPKVAILILKLLGSMNNGVIRPESVIDTEVENISKEQKASIDAAINALGCDSADFAKVFPLINRFSETHIENNDFRTELYAYLQNAPEEYYEQISKLKIIPVYGIDGGIKYINWIDDGIFVKKNTTKSTTSYWVLNENLLSKAFCEKMMGVNINEMNAGWERSRYNEQLKKIVSGDNLEDIYNYLLSEFNNGSLRRNDSLGTLLANKESIPLKNENEELTDTELFLCDQPVGYFPVPMIQNLTIHKECEGFGRFIQCRELRAIHYEDVCYYEDLTEDDVEVLLDDYFDNKDEILKGFYQDGYLSEELIEEYNLEYLTFGNSSSQVDQTYQFPEQPVIDRNSLRRHVNKLWNNPVRVVSVKVERTVHKGQRNGGEMFDLGINDAREGAIKIYSPEGSKNICFCQMCHSTRPYRLIEVNNIELNPQYYFPQLRIALCLDCSKKFEYLRHNESVRKSFFNSIVSEPISIQGKVDIPIGDDAITFTGKHLAEIQEILRNMPSE